MNLSTIPRALDELRAGKPVIVVDAESRENEGDIVIAAQFATQEWIAWTVKNSSGLICAPMSNDVADRLDLPIMVLDSEDIRGTNYTVTVDAADQISTGISASDRAQTLRVLADPSAERARLHRPGHVLPLRAAAGGVRERAGHTEAAVDLMRLAGLVPVAAIAEIVADDGEMMLLPGLVELGEREGIAVVSIEALIAYLDREREPNDHGLAQAVSIDERLRVAFEVETTIPTTHGSFRVRAYRDRTTGADHIAVISGALTDGALVRVHSECLTGEALGSLKCECGPQLDSALDTIEREGGVVIYLRGQEGRGIGLTNKLRAYQLQEEGLDTLDANLALGFPADVRDYGAAVGILADLNVASVRLLTNNPDKVNQLVRRGVAVTERVPLVVGIGAANRNYLETKRDRMGHSIEQSHFLEGHNS
jgi:3,4-dihydroxy 2-butanone 4-phosphate synthase/GTP cyclohydrolase II